MKQVTEQQFAETVQAILARCKAKKEQETNLRSEKAA